MSRAGWGAGVGGFVGAAFLRDGGVGLGENIGFWNCGLVGLSSSGEIGRC